MRALLILPVAVLLFGCTPGTIAAIASQDALEFHDAAKRAVARKVQARNEIWTRCRDLLFDEVDTLRAVGDSAGARALLFNAWPKLRSIELLGDLIDGEVEQGEFDVASLCNVNGPEHRTFFRNRADALSF